MHEKASRGRGVSHPAEVQTPRDWQSFHTSANILWLDLGQETQDSSHGLLEPLSVYAVPSTGDIRVMAINEQPEGLLGQTGRNDRSQLWVTRDEQCGAYDLAGEILP